MKYLFSILLLLGILRCCRNTWNRHSKSSTIIDMSKACMNNLEENVYLPYGMGTADSLALIISNMYNRRKCAVVFHKEILNQNITKIIVIEFLSNVKNVSDICNDGNIYIIENYDNSVDLCKLFNSTKFENPFVFTTQFHLKLKIEDFRKFTYQALKITATASRKLKIDETCTADEITCGFNNSSTCISAELRCDDNINCGRADWEDEDQNICKRKGRKSLVLVIFVSIFISIILIYSIVYRIKKWCPKLKKHLNIRNKNEENTIVLSNYAPAIKTYIPKKNVKTMHLRVASTKSSRSSEIDEEFLQAGFYKKKNQLGDSPVRSKKNR